MKAKVYLSHNCEEHRKYLGLTPDEACCNHQEMVGDYEVELLDTENKKIDFVVPPSGMDGINATITGWREKYGTIETEYIK